MSWICTLNCSLFIVKHEDMIWPCWFYSSPLYIFIYWPQMLTGRIGSTYSACSTQVFFSDLSCPTVFSWWRTHEFPSAAQIKCAVAALCDLMGFQRKTLPGMNKMKLTWIKNKSVFGQNKKWHVPMQFWIFRSLIYSCFIYKYIYFDPC